MEFTSPAKFKLHVQPVGTLVPVLEAGQSTAEQELKKNGTLVAATTVPLNPELQKQPPVYVATFAPLLFAGHETGVHEER